jgi:hypothetical protein
MQINWDSAQSMSKKLAEVLAWLAACLDLVAYAQKRADSLRHRREEGPVLATFRHLAIICRSNLPFVSGWRKVASTGEEVEKARRQSADSWAKMEKRDIIVVLRRRACWGA